MDGEEALARLQVNTVPTHVTLAARRPSVSLTHARLPLGAAWSFVAAGSVAAWILRRRSRSAMASLEAV